MPAGLAVARRRNRPRGRGQRELHEGLGLAADPELHRAGELPDQERPPPRCSARQTQNGASRQSPSPAQSRDRMVLAPDPVERCGSAPARRCGSAGTWADGPGDARRTRGTPRSRRPVLSGTSRFRTPQLASERPPRQREPQAEAVGPAREAPTHAGPEVVDHRIGAPRLPRTCADPVGEGGEQSFVLDLQLLEGDLAAPFVELDAADAGAARHRDCGDADRRPTSGCRCRRPGSGRRRPARGRSPAAAKFLIQTPGWNSSG